MFLRIALFALAAAAWSMAQTTFATITGTVTDPNGAVVPGATVEATHLESNYKTTAQSNESGVYTLTQLREGEYTVRARVQGFQEFVAQGVQLVARDLRRIEIQLRVGSVDTSIEVKAGATLIETETARIGNTKGASTLQALPLNTRSLYDFLGLTAGVIGAGGGQATRRFAGSRVNQSDQSIDGVTVSNGYDGTQISPLVSYIGGFEEVRVDLANNTADIGSIGQVTVISKSGTNQFHGMGWDYYSTPVFRARNPFSPARPAGVSHAPGFQVGGPVKIPGVYNGVNRTFFLFSFETSRGSAIEQLFNPGVPLTAWRSGDFSRLTTLTLRDPGATTPFANNTIPASRINPVAQKIQTRFFPLQNFGDPNVFATQNYRTQVTRPFDPNTYYTARGDHRFSDKTFMYGRWTWNRSFSRAYEGNLPAIGRRWQTRDTRALAASFSHTISPSLISETRFGITYNDNPLHGALMGKEVVQDLGLIGLADNLPDINGLPQIGFSGIGIQTISQSQWRHPGFKNYVQQYQQHINWFRGKHSLKAGFILSRVRFQDNQASTNLFGNLTFSAQYTGHPYGDFLLGIPASAARAFAPIEVSRLRWAEDFFVTDDFKVTPTLTLNIGLRYEYHPGYKEELGQQAIFDTGTGKIVVPDGALGRVSSLLPRGYVDVVEAGKAGWPSQTLLLTDKNNLAPRFGLAWRPFGPNTVFRMGYGIFYDVVPRAVGAGGAPFTIAEPTFTNPAGTPTIVLPRVFPATAARAEHHRAPRRHSQGSPRSVQHAVQLHHRASTLEHRLPCFLHRNQHATRPIRIQHQSARCRWAALCRQTAAVPELSGNYLSGQRRRPSVSFDDTRGAAEDGGRTVFPSGLDLRPRHRRSRPRSDGRRRLQPPPRTQRLARYSHPPPERKRDLRVAVRPRKEIPEQRRPDEQDRRWLGCERGLQRIHGPVPDAAVDGSRPDGNGVHRQPHSGAGDHPAEPVTQREPEF
ncbi:MAG: carboxypeptidase regulatory-like domain-containing protein [Bryobacteraceae bacterium]